MDTLVLLTQLILFVIIMGPFSVFLFIVLFRRKDYRDEMESRVDRYKRNE